MMAARMEAEMQVRMRPTGPGWRGHLRRIDGDMCWCQGGTGLTWEDKRAHIIRRRQLEVEGARLGGRPGRHANKDRAGWMRQSEEGWRWRHLADFLSGLDVEGKRHEAATC